MSEAGGFDDLRRVFRQLPDVAQKRVATNVIRAAAVGMQKEVRSAAKEISSQEKRSKASIKYGPIWKAIKISRSRNKSRDNISWLVHTGRAFYGRFIEYGTSKFPPHPWFRPATERAAPAMRTEMAKRLGKGIEREAARLAKSFRSARKSVGK